MAQERLAAEAEITNARLRRKEKEDARADEQADEQEGNFMPDRLGARKIHE